MNDDLKTTLKDAWSNLESEVLRKGYWRIKKESNNPRLSMYVTDLEVFKMDTFKEILIQRLEW
jgi:hypothetical protein